MKKHILTSVEEFYELIELGIEVLDMYLPNSGWTKADDCLPSQIRQYIKDQELYILVE